MPRRRLLVRCGYAIAATITLGTVVDALVVPRLVRRRILASLNSAGIEAIQFDIRRMTPWRLELAGFQAGKTRPSRVATIAVRYSPATLWQGRIRDIRVTGADLMLAVQDGGIDAGVLSRLRSAGPSIGQQKLNLPLDRIDLESSAVAIQLPQQMVRVPVRGSLVRQEDGRLQIDLELKLGRRALQFAGTIGPTAADADLTAGGEGLDAAVMAAIASAFSPGIAIAADGTLSAAARTRWSGRQGEIELTIQPDVASLTVARPNRSEQPTQVRGIAGVVQGNVNFAPGVPMRAKLTLRQAGFHGEPWAIRVEQMAGVVAFDDLAKLVTHPAQTFTFGRLAIGKTELAEGSVVFRMNGPHAIRVDKTQWLWLGGTIWAENFSLDLSRPVWDATVHVADLDLHQLLAFLVPDQASGEGKISGQVPLVVDWPDIRFGDALLRAKPGGTLRVKDLEAMSAALGQSGGSDASGLQREVLEALGDFRYDLLQASLRTDARGLAADVHLTGTGRSGARRPLDIQWRIHGLDDILSLYLGFQRGTSSPGQGK